MSRRYSKDTDVEGCLLMLFTIAFIWLAVSLAIAFFDALINHTSNFFMVVCAIILGLMAIAEISNFKDKRDKKKYYNEILDSTEKSVDVYEYVVYKVFSTKEEERVNNTLYNLIENYNATLVAKAHIEYWGKRVEAFQYFDNEVEKEKAEKKLLMLNSEYGKLSDSLKIKVNDFYNPDKILMPQDIKDKYFEFIKYLPVNNIDMISNIINYDSMRAVFCNANCILIYTPEYILIYRGLKQITEVVHYKDVSVEAEVYTEFWGKELMPYDEIADSFFLHSNKDGTCDMRYNYENNPLIRSVYRGKVIIKVGSITHRISCLNKSTTTRMENLFREIIDYDSSNN